MKILFLTEQQVQLIKELLIGELELKNIQEAIDECNSPVSNLEKTEGLVCALSKEDKIEFENWYSKVEW